MRKNDAFWRSGALLQRRVIQLSELYIVMGGSLIINAVYWNILLAEMRVRAGILCENLPLAQVLVGVGSCRMWS